MAKYTIEIKETLSRLVEVEAGTVEEAIEQVSGRYYDADIILDSDDCQGTDIMEYNCG